MAQERGNLSIRRSGGRTHGIHAEPTTFGIKLAVLYAEMKRAKRAHGTCRENDLGWEDFRRFVGTFEHLDPSVEEYVCAKLGLEAAPVSTRKSFSGIDTRSFSPPFALVGASLRKNCDGTTAFAAHEEVREVEEFFASGQKGSSAMPHKRNPITWERVTGLARLLRGYAMTAMENVALWHERDISHSSTERIIGPDATIALDYMLDLMARSVQTMFVSSRSDA